MKLETTPEERLYWPHHPDAQADVARAARDISALLARNEELEQALRAVFEYLYKTKGPDDPWSSQLFTRLYDLLGVEGMSPDETAALVGADRDLINGEGK